MSNKDREEIVDTVEMEYMQSFFQFSVIWNIFGTENVAFPGDHLRPTEAPSLC